VSGFPTLKFFPKGNKAGEDYGGGRDLDDFVAFINEKSGTSRDAKGQLTSEVSEFRSKRSILSLSLIFLFYKKIGGSGHVCFEGIKNSNCCI
jgi:hypothetical protein